MKCIEIEPNNDINRLLLRCGLSIIRSGYGLFGEEGILLPIDYKRIANRIESFEIKNSDVVVASFPRSGTIWVQEMVWMIENNLDYQSCETPLTERFPFLEKSAIFSSHKLKKVDPEIKWPEEAEDSVKFTANQKNPRLIKTHLPFSLLPKQIREQERKPKIIYVIRNPKDVCVSDYYQSALLTGFVGTIDQFSELFLNDRVTYAPYWTNIKSYWERRNESNILIVSYEDMILDLRTEIKRVSSFLEKDLSDDDITRLMEHLSFENMSKRPGLTIGDNLQFLQKYQPVGSEKRLFRKGKMNSFKDELKLKTIQVFDEWTRRNIADTDLLFCKNLF